MNRADYNVGNLESEIKVQFEQAVSALNQTITALDGVVSLLKDTNSQLNNLKSNTGLKNLQKQSTGFGNAFKSTIKFGAIYGVLRKGFNTVKDITSASIDMIETTNLFEVQMGKVVDEYGNLDEAQSQYYTKAMAFQDKMNEKLATNKSEMQKYQAMYYGMLNSQLGSSNRDASYLMSESLTKAGYDIASLYNLDVETAMNKLKSGLAGQIESLRQIGIDVSEASLAKVLDEVGIDRSVQQLSYAEKEVARYIAIVEQAGKAQGDFARTFEQPANQLRVFQNQLLELKQVAGSFFVGLFGQIMPVINGIIMAIKEILKALGSVFGFEVDMGNSSLGAVEDTVGDIDSGIGSAIKKAKEFKKQLMGFDEINNITPPTESSGGSGGGTVTGVDSALLDALKEWDNKMDSISGKAQEIRDKMLDWLGFVRNDDGTWKLGEGLTNFEKILDIVKTIGEVLLTWKVSSTITNLLRNLGVFGEGDSAKQTAFKWAFGATLTFTGLSLTYKGISHLIEGDVDLFTILETVLGLGTSSLGIITILKATKYGKKISLGKSASIGFGLTFLFAGLYAQYEGTKKAFSGKADFADILSSVLGTAGAGIGIAQLLKASKYGQKISYGKGLTIGLSVSFAIQGLEGLYSTMDELKNKAIDTEEATKNALISSAETISSFTLLGGSIGGGLGATIGAGVGIITSLGTALLGLNGVTKEAQGETEGFIQKLQELQETHADTIDSIKDTMNADLVAIDTSKEYEKQLENLIDSNGRVIEGNESRVDFILGELNDALGTELTRDEDVIRKNGEVVDSYDEIKESIDKKIESLEREIKLDAYKKLAEKEIEYYIEVKKSREDAEKTLEKLKENYEKNSGSMRGTSKKLAEAMIEESQKVVDGLKQDESNAYNNYKNYLQDWENETTDTTNEISNGLQESVKNTTGTVESTVDSAITSIQAKAPEAKEAGYTIGSSAIEGVNSGTSIISQIGQGIATKFSSGISSLVSLAQNAGSNLGNNARIGVNSNISSSTQLGKDFATGFINGIQSLVSNVVSTASNFAKKALDTIRKVQNSHSPSKVTMGLGNDYGEGYILGIQNKMPETIKTATELATSATQALNDNLNIEETFSQLNQGIKINTKDFAVDTNQYVNYSAIKGQILAQSQISMNENIADRIAEAVTQSMKNAEVNVNIEARTDEGVVVKKVSEGFREYVMQTGELPFPVPV